MYTIDYNSYSTISDISISSYQPSSVGILLEQNLSKGIIIKGA